MKSILVFFAALFFAISAAAQTNFAKADSIALNYKGKYTDLADLAKQLTAPFTTEAEKARVLFVWVADNIRYDVEKFENPPRTQVSAKTREELERKKKEAQEAELRSSFKSKKGVCEDYSSIYKAMCEAVGLACEVIRGDAREFYKPYQAAHNNPHAWNAVKIDGQWQLLDATWAAGYVRNRKFTRRLELGHFMTPPLWFVQRHLPDDLKWELLDQPIDSKRFPTLPLINYGQSDYPLLDFSQELEKLPDGRVQARFQFSTTPKVFLVVNSQSKNPIEFEQKEEGGFTIFQFTPRGRGDVTIYMGEAMGDKMEWLARYDIR